MAVDGNLTEELIEKFQSASKVIDDFIDKYETPPELKDDILEAPMQYWKIVFFSSLFYIDSSSKYRWLTNVRIKPWNKTDRWLDTGSIPWVSHLLDSSIDQFRNVTWTTKSHIFSWKGWNCRLLEQLPWKETLFVDFVRKAIYWQGIFSWFCFFSSQSICPLQENMFPRTFFHGSMLWWDRWF